MYKVILIDDEEPVREAIRILGNWQDMGVEEVLEARDGASGLAMLEEYRPDLALVDMKMPGMNGLAFLQTVEREFPDLVIIVISGYDDFEYTRQAIRSKVIDYLLKPVNRHDLNQALQKAIRMLENRQASTNEFVLRNIELNMSLPKLKEKLYFSILEGSFKKQNNEAFLPLVGADDPLNRFGVAVLRILNLEQVRRERFSQDMDLLHFALANVIDDPANGSPQRFSFVSPKQEREIIVIFTMTEENLDELSYKAAHVTKRAANRLHELFGVHVVYSVGELCSEVTGLAELYEEARSSIQAVDLLSLPRPAVIDAAAKGAASLSGKEVISLTSSMPLIRNAMEAGNFNLGRGVLREYTAKVREASGFPLQDADRAIRELIVLLNDLALGKGVPAQELPAGADTLMRIGISADFATFDQFAALLDRVLSFYCERIRQERDAERPFEVSDIKTYIDHHYFEDIKISMFTEKYFLSREYLMKLYKQQYGIGIHAYVQKVRMDKAKELLHDPNLKIQEISDLLGYKDKNYFSKAFRNYYALSPTEYREK